MRAELRAELRARLHAALRHAMSHVPSPRRERAHSNAQSPPGSGAAPADVHANVKPVRVIE